MRTQSLLLSIGAIMLSVGIGVEAAQPPSAGDATFKPLPAPCRLKEDGAFKAVRLPSGADTNQWQSSSDCELMQTSAAGDGTVAGKTVRWAGHYALKNGCWMLHSMQPVLVDIGPAHAYVAEGTNAVLHTANSSTRIVNLTDKHRSSVIVVFEHNVVELEPGQELVLMPIEEMNSPETPVHDALGWKDMHSTQTDDLYVYVFRVNPADVLTKCKIYRSLAASQNQVDVKIREELVKTVAALDTMYNKKQGPFYLDPFRHGNQEPREREQASTHGSV